MIGTILHVSWLTLKRDYVALGLTFLLPVVFFSIFAGIFSGMGGGNGASVMRPLSVLVVRGDDEPFSHRFAQELDGQDMVNVTDFVDLAQTVEDTETPAPAHDPEPETELETAVRLVRVGTFDAAVVLPANLLESIADFGGQAPPAKVVYDPSNPASRMMLEGVMQSTAMNSAPGLMMNRGLDMFVQYGGPLTESQKSAVESGQSFFGGDQGSGAGSTGLIAVESIDARQFGKQEKDPEKKTNIVAYYAAGIGVMFLLFSMTGAGGALLEEEESGTLDRLLTSRLSIGSLLFGKWLFFGFVGIAQLTLMFVWGALVFDLDLFSVKHFAGFAVMTLVSAAAASAFGILLATFAKSRAQLSGMSTILILVMSAMGGSMVPRFVMPAYMDRAAKFTFNGWAIDGFLKVFWRENPDHDLLESLLYLAPEVSVLGAMAIVFLAIAGRFARRWQPA
ncbi:ABC transporter permease [Sulfidibacter corallicola]|uniref:ABC transporter permease n=1 Tax=Sulfidibacter corallicola TaxID=2818388 RepID=A0A8A4TRC6_SULCO|nr:ABC transporter permease [Sulfidibacter corallicola]QTD51947.1 ABC transporter permease [Sulfidibacter corallicola]